VTRITYATVVVFFLVGASSITATEEGTNDTVYLKQMKLPSEHTIAARTNSACVLRELDSSAEDGAVEVRISKTLQVECEFYITEFFGKLMIYASPKLVNPTKKTVYFHFYAAFFDKDKTLIGCSPSGLRVDGGETLYQTCLVRPVKGMRLQDTAYYQIVLYEFDEEVGYSTPSYP